jgi:hypothetical protein
VTVLTLKAQTRKKQFVEEKNGKERERERERERESESESVCTVDATVC